MKTKLMISRWVTLLSSLLLAACDRQPPEPIENRRASLSGEWDFIMLDGVPVMPMGFVGSETTFYYRPACAGYGLNYDIEGDEIRFQRPKRSGVMTVCLPGIPDDLPQVLNALQHASRFEHHPSRAVTLRGGRHSLVFIPTGKKIVRAVDSLEGRWQIDQIDGRAVKPNEKNILIGDQYSLRSSIGCGRQARNYAIVGNRFAAYRLAHPLPPPSPLSTKSRPAECNEAPPPIVDEVFALIDNVTKIDKIGQHDVALRSSDGSILRLKRIDILEALVGEWRIVEINGRTQSEAVGIVLSITDTDISFAPVCAGFEWDYSYSGNALATRRPITVKPGPQFETPSCFVGVGLGKARLAKTLDGVTRAELTPKGQVLLSGPAGTLLLVLQ